MEEKINELLFDYTLWVADYTLNTLKGSQKGIKISDKKNELLERIMRVIEKEYKK